jgi:hypothetical protein
MKDLQVAERRNDAWRVCCMKNGRGEICISLEKII